MNRFTAKYYNLEAERLILLASGKKLSFTEILLLKLYKFLGNC